MCFGDEFIDSEKVAAVIEGDPAICGRLLGLANSAYFGLPEPVTCIGEVTSRVLGVDTVRSLVLAMAIQQSFNNRNCPAFNTTQFWVDSLAIAECCKKVALAQDADSDCKRDLAYSTGLCYNLGLLALAHIEPQRTNTVLRRMQEPDSEGDLSDLLLRELELDHRILTAELTRIWSLPAPMVSAYEFRAFPKIECQDRLGLVLVAAVAAVKLSRADDDSLTGEFDQLAQPLGLVSGELLDMAEMSRRQQERVKSMASNMAR